jgi:hypothetical protein
MALKNLKKHFLILGPNSVCCGAGLLQVVLSPTCISPLLWFAFVPPGHKNFADHEEMDPKAMWFTCHSPSSMQMIMQAPTQFYMRRIKSSPGDLSA